MGYFDGLVAGMFKEQDGDHYVLTPKARRYRTKADFERGYDRAKSIAMLNMGLAVAAYPAHRIIGWEWTLGILAAVLGWTALFSMRMIAANTDPADIRDTIGDRLDRSAAAHGEGMYVLILIGSLVFGVIALLMGITEPDDRIGAFSVIAVLGLIAMWSLSMIRRARRMEPVAQPAAPTGPALSSPDQPSTPTMPAVAASTVPAPTLDIDRLEKLAELRDRGVLTDAEYQAERTRVLTPVATINMPPSTVAAGPVSNKRSWLGWTALAAMLIMVAVAGAFLLAPRAEVPTDEVASPAQADPNPSLAPSLKQQDTAIAPMPSTPQPNPCVGQWVYVPANFETDTGAGVKVTADPLFIEVAFTDYSRIQAAEIKLVGNQISFRDAQFPATGTSTLTCNGSTAVLSAEEGDQRIALTRSDKDIWEIATERGYRSE